jgi:tetratricopeptide (TPR) repeat protein
MGIVYRALDRLHGGPCAVKMLEVTTNARRFLREARILARLTHPAIVRYVGQGIAPNGNLFLAMEWVEGTDLERRLELGPLSAGETVALARRLGEALSAVHAEGIVHRDLKPSNVFLPEGKLELAKLGDFGIAHTARTSRETGTLTQTGMILGTPGYLAPEQLRAASTDPRTDLFGLGCILFECLAGRPAFSADTLVALLAKIAFDPTPRLRDVRPDAPEALDALLGALLAKEIDQRPRSAADVVAALASIDVPDAGSTAIVSARPVGTAERRLVPVVVCPGPEVEAGPSDTQALLPSRSALAELGTRSGARLELLPDGSVIGVLDAVSEGATEQALRAARLARELGAYVAQRPIAIAMGRVVVASGVWVSEVVEQAMALLADTPKGAIVLDDDASALLEARFDVQREGTRITLGEEQAQKLVPRRLLGRATPFVGRRRELSLLLSTLEECVAESYARAMLVTAPPGIGKSRLLSELLAEARARLAGGFHVLVGRGDPALAGVPFGLLGDTIRRNAGIRAGDGPDDRVAKLRALTGVGHDANPGLVAFLGEIAGLELPDAMEPRLRAARRDPPMMSVLTRDAFIDWLRRAAGDGGLLLALDDLHWADTLSIQLIDAALGALPNAALCVLVLGRPEVREAYPRLFDTRDITELALGRLSRRACEELVAAVLGGVDAALLATIVERAEGNAFFLEELIRAGAQGQVENLPDTVLGVMESRLADLEGEARVVLRAASVFGESCWEGSVRAVLGEVQAQDVGGWLATLAAREILVREPMSRFRGEREYGFRHALLRDASYASFDDADRRAAHRRAASWLETQGEAAAAVLASHWERAGDVLRAGAAYVRAVEQALRGNDLELAVALVARAERLGVGGEVLGALRLLESEALTWMGAPERALTAAAEAVALLPRASASWYSAVATAVEAAMLVGRIEGAAAPLGELATDDLGPADQAESRAAALSRASFALVLLGRASDARELLARVERLDTAYGLTDPMTLAHRAHALAAQAMIERRREAAARFYARAADAFESSGALRLASGARTNVAAMYLEIGAAERALGELDGALELAEKAGAIYTLVLARLNRAIALGRVGKTSEATLSLRAVLDELTRQGDRRLAASAGCALAEVLAGARDLEAAEAAARGAIAAAESLPACLAGALTTLAFVQLQSGQAEAALVTARAADAHRKDAAMEERETLLELVLAEAAFATGERAEARARLARLAQTLERDAAEFESPELRRIFLERLPENQKLRELERAFTAED